MPMKRGRNVKVEYKKTVRVIASLNGVAMRIQSRGALEQLWLISKSLVSEAGTDFWRKDGLIPEVGMDLGFMERERESDF